MAPPKRGLNLEMVRNLAAIQCTVEEIAAVMKVSERTLRRRADVAAAIKAGKQDGRASLRREQYKAAIGGNPTMLIWLGKNVLGQKDRHDVTTNDEPMEAVWLPPLETGSATGRRARQAAASPEAPSPTPRSRSRKSPSPPAASDASAGAAPDARSVAPSGATKPSRGSRSRASKPAPSPAARSKP